MKQALLEIAQMSDCGSAETAMLRMKQIAADALNKLELSEIKITPESLIELGFESAGKYHKYMTKALKIYVYRLKIIDVSINDVFVDTNATTIEDIKDLIRLFK